MSPYYQEFEEDSQNDEWSIYFERLIARISETNMDLG